MHETELETICMNTENSKTYKPKNFVHEHVALQNEFIQGQIIKVLWIIL